MKTVHNFPRTVLAIVGLLLSGSVVIAYDYVLNAPITGIASAGIFVEVYANDIWNGENGADSWTIPGGDWCNMQVINGVQSIWSDLNGDGKDKIQIPFKVDSIVVADFVYAGGGQHNVINAKTIYVQLDAGTYWIDFDQRGSIRLIKGKKAPKDFGKWTSFGTPLVAN